jgi:hypothetical protein
MTFSEVVIYLVDDHQCKYHPVFEENFEKLLIFLLNLPFRIE